MFPCTITIHNQSQLAAVIAVLGNGLPAAPPAAGPVPGQRTAPAGAAHAKTGNGSSPAAASAATGSQASTAATGDAGNGTSAGPSAGATAASSSKPDASPAVTFDGLKKAFLALSTKPNGRALCEGVLKPLGLGKLSEAKPEQYANLQAAIENAAQGASN